MFFIFSYNFTNINILFFNDCHVLSKLFALSLSSFYTIMLWKFFLFLWFFVWHKFIIIGKYLGVTRLAAVGMHVQSFRTIDWMFLFHFYINFMFYLEVIPIVRELQGVSIVVSFTQKTKAVVVYLTG